MKDSEFIELLNLYLDHEITAADAARLEAEVQGNPSRRRVYQGYCRMQKACKLVAQDFATPANPADRKVVAFARPHSAGAGRRTAWLSAAGLAAAAAFVAVVFVQRSHDEAAVPAPANAVVQTVPAAHPAAAQPVAAPPPAQMVAAQSPAVPAARTDDAWSLRHVPQPHDALALAPTVPNDPHFAWMQEVQLRPLQAPAQPRQLQFQLTPDLRPENRTYSSGKQPLPSDVPWIAIRFQK